MRDDANDNASPIGPTLQNDQKVTKSPTERPDRTKYVAIVISLASLMATAFSFYFLNVQVRHDFKGTLYWVSVHDRTGKSPLTGKFLMVNRGNQYEVLRYVSFLLASDQGCVNNFELTEHMGPLTFKPGESSVSTLSARITTNDRDNIKKMFTVDQRVYLCGYFNVLGPDGSPTAKPGCMRLAQ